MKKIVVGIDSGSTMCKSVVMSGERIIDTLAVKTGWNPQTSAEESLAILRERNGLDSQEISVAATGYGREAIDFADYTMTEITCHAYGGVYLMPDIQGIIDIGGQDSKVIQIQGGKPVNFLMNDKCAAGTGRFLKMACDILEIPLDQIDEFTDPHQAVPINSMCTVFAESEIIGLLAMQKDRAQIMAGVLQSIARKIQQQAGRIEFTADQPILMTGGLSRSGLLMDTIARHIGYEVKSCPQALYAGAIGACISAAQKSQTTKPRGG
ncbi:MAG TPA: activase [Desulfitobacterium dehalogenans]|uniref:Activase n=1 Tax=Desulfitobacterium dehalogenans TaxID=36854 RepID=A0A7C7D480_9FIRM|nr:activase [Desulfitobacterium dehalogenans]